MFPWLTRAEGTILDIKLIDKGSDRCVFEITLTKKNKISIDKVVANYGSSYNAYDFFNKMYWTSSGKTVSRKLARVIYPMKFHLHQGQTLNDYDINSTENKLNILNV